MGTCASALTNRNSDSSGSKFGMLFVPSKTDNHVPRKSKRKNSITSASDQPIAFKSQVSPFNAAPASGQTSASGSKDETFFESRAWLESDGEEDYYSLNGDFTPSRGSTPVHGSAAGTPRANRTVSVQANRVSFEGRPPLHSGSYRSRGSTPLHQSAPANTSAPEVSKDAVVGKTSESKTNASSSSSSPDKKKKLVELFRESRGGDYDEVLPLSGSQSEIDANGRRSNALRKGSGTPSLLSTASSVSTLSGERTPSGECRAEPERVKALKSAQCCFPRFVPSRSFSERKTPTASPIIVDA